MQLVSWLVTLHLVIWLRWCLPYFSNIKLPFFFLQLISSLCEFMGILFPNNLSHYDFSIHPCLNQLSPQWLLNGDFLILLFPLHLLIGVLLQNRALHPHHGFPPFLVSVWTHRFLKGTYIPYIIHFNCSNCSRFGQWEYLVASSCELLSQYYFFEYFLTFWHKKMFKAHFVLFLPYFWNLPFLKGSLVPFGEEWYLKTKTKECSFLLECYCF